jgi:dTDP-4-dehydrorhamnose 3,5-epimerase
MHMQVEHTQGKLVRVTSGAVFDVVVDLREASPSFGRWWGTELSDQNRRMLWVPPGLAHGILVTSASADFLYKCTDFYSPAHERTLAWNDATVGIEWPLPSGVEPKLSAKDAAGKSFAEIEKFP